MKFQGHRIIRSENISILVKGSISKSGKSYIFAIYFNTIKSTIKWAIVVIITPNLVSILKMIVLYVCAKKISKIYCSHCFSLFLAYFACFSLFWLKMTSFWDKMSHSAAGENQNGPKIVMQTCFIGIY